MPAVPDSPPSGAEPAGPASPSEPVVEDAAPTPPDEPAAPVEANDFPPSESASADPDSVASPDTPKTPDAGRSSGGETTTPADSGDPTETRDADPAETAAEATGPAGTTDTESTETDAAPARRRRRRRSSAARPAEDLRPRLRELGPRDEHRLERKYDRLRHQHDPEIRARDLERLLTELTTAEEKLTRRRGLVPAVSYPEQLPVSQRKDDLLAAIRDHQVVVVAGETGSGKTTQLPKICLELGRGIRGQIAHTQPRRIAARTVAERIAEELNVPLGDAVGYSVRFNDHSSDDTLVRLLTDGLLLAEIQRDRLLRRYDTIIIDEAHERSLNIDFLLGCIKQILPQRPDLKVIITSATIDPERFSKHFDDAPIIEVSGRTFPVEVRYRPVLDPDDPNPDPDRDQVDAIGDAVEELMRESEAHPTGPGDILVFLSGEREIRDTAEALNGRFGRNSGPAHPRRTQGVEILPLYARLATTEQQRVFRRGSSSLRRVVLATNVAETSLTVPGIKYVIDPGSARISRYSARLKVQRLPIERISQASANQRKGRCGRTSDGICIRLYTEDDFEERSEYTDPEILRTNLASVILQMASLGLGEVRDFPFLEPPDRAQIRDGLMLLHELGALAEGSDGRPSAGASEDDAADERRATKAPAGEATTQLTPIGRKLAQLPVDPRMGRMVLEADRLGVTEEVVVIAAALSIQDPRERPTDKQQAAEQSHARFKHEQSDFLGYLNLWDYLRQQQRELSSNQFRKRCHSEFLHYLRIREWQDLVAQLRQAAKQVGITVPRDGTMRGIAPAGSDGRGDGGPGTTAASGEDQATGAGRGRGSGSGRTATSAAEASAAAAAADAEHAAASAKPAAAAVPHVGAPSKRRRRGGKKPAAAAQPARAASETASAAVAPLAGRTADTPRAEQQIHVALLSGLLSHLGLKDETQKKDQQGRIRAKGRPQRAGRPEFLGARGGRFQIFPGSTLAKSPPTWVMVAELVETSRLWGRTAARINPEWVEPLAEHLLKRTYAEPRWSKKRASAVADERALLYGLPIVAGRTVAYGRLDPIVSRELFIQHALVEGDWDGRHRFLEDNRALVEEVEAMEERARRRDILVEDDEIFAFYEERIPAEVVSGAHFDRWWKRQRDKTPDLLTFPRELLISERAVDAVDVRERPEAWKQGDVVLKLSYRFEPGTDHDGVTVHVPLTILPQVKSVGFEWLVPGLRRELVTALVRGLPKEIRRELVPVPDTVERLLTRMTPRSAPLPVTLARELNELPGVQVSPAMLRLDQLPGHLRMTFRIEDENGNELAGGHDLDALREQLRPKLREALTAAVPDLERHGLTAWTVGTLPRSVGLGDAADGGSGVRVYPALVDEGKTVGVRGFDSAELQAEAMRAGTRKLLLLNIPSPARYVRGQLDMAAQLTLATAPHGNLDAVIDDAVRATVDGLTASAGGPAWDEAGFKRLRDHVAGHLATATVKVLGQVVLILDAEREVRSRLEAMAARPTKTGSAFDIAQRDVTAQLRRLVFPGFIAAAGARRLPDIVRYLRAAAHRLDRLPDAQAADADRTNAIHELERQYQRRAEAWPKGRPRPDALREVPWMIEELRVAQFAQGLGAKKTTGPAGSGKPISSKRIRKLLDEVAAAA